MLNRLGPPLLVLAVAIIVVGLSYSGALGGEREPERPSTSPEPTVVIDLSEQPPEDEPPTRSPGTSTSDAVSPNGAGESGEAAQEPATGEIGPDGTGEEAPGAADGSIPHVVGEGETLWSIARAHGVSVAELMEVNGIQDPTALQVGEELDIP